MNKNAGDSKEKRSIVFSAICMVITCAITPAMVLPYVGHSGNGSDVISYQIIALVWAYNSLPWAQGPALQFFNIYMMFEGVIFAAPLFIFGYAVIRYIQNQVSLAKLFGAALLSIIIPLVLAIIYIIISMAITSTGAIGYAGPVPIHFLVGAILIKLFRESAEIPWAGEDENPWWEE